MNQTQPNKPKMRIVFVGTFGVGKTSLIQQYCNEEFHENPVSIDKINKEDKRKKNVFDIEMVDSMGIEKDDPNNYFYFQKCHGCALVFDRTSQESFDALQQLYTNIKKYGSQDMSLILIGNKSDGSVVVQNGIAQQFATEHSMRYFALTAKQHSQVVESVEYLVDLIYKNYYKENKSCYIV
ncbi:GTP-binding protein, Ras family protein [Entamoeba histolytica HM-1:IMSS-B]|uniref:GTP-binding protein, Ras family n=6 Tax=Entamoeba histolytica TaxID=5759 RepID=C4M2G2_ENTH1|nr:GTP-binding protein, Ras family [Entamoeba histolytica HM-1:IMSS]EMD43357.1 GTPbinding protein Ras family protein [Entamoeba histolytica KU27]EMH73337.1 GTP-binding protein, Ras family protein [Entamoeba histolytica HM-1:IMSS-B]EMS15462.1 GTP-binding protein, Ras family protein [Entamoeba histolytica HM-3:IMSS]ENY65801.1 GTP-binding protein, Ras family protein, putative [Entamoeba histolytica HM-1:IMSS-A]GAT95464.1 GTP-binding protein Ras family [Entamoeba histolytica]|eukprot:XP_651849.1 GTP-binding protein, Ras family [Entamoeba histolytica HM-1:IMSS]